MKKIFLIICILILTGTVFGQVTYVDTLANGADTTYTLRLRAVYPWQAVTLENIGTGADTLTAKILTFIKYEPTGVIIDTSIAKPWIKDDEGTDVTTMIVAQGATRIFLIMKPIVQGLEIALSNTDAAGNTRVIIEGWKPD